MGGALALLILATAAPHEPYVWPLDAPPAVTSSFGEYREGRFHAGLDLRTVGDNRPVRAPSSGWVSRVRCSPWGYGKALYLRLDDGNTAVFGHLSDFAPAVREYVRGAQHAARDYSVDLEPAETMFRFEAGDVVATSGDTGIGPAHLHYELRDEHGVPFNLRLAGVSWPDTMPPVLQAIIVVPDGPNSTVNGKVGPQVLSCRPMGPGEYRCDTIRARGRIGFGADLVDPANQGGSKLGIHTLRTMVAGEEIFSTTLDRISYEETRHEVVSYHPFLTARGRYLLQWRWPGNGCNAFANGREGWVDVGGEPLAVRLEAEDFLGNKAGVSLTVEPDEAVSGEANGWERVIAGFDPGRVELFCLGTWLTISAQWPNPESVLPELRVEGAGDISPFRSVSDFGFSGSAAPAPWAELLKIEVEHPRLKSVTRHIHVFRQGDAARTVQLGEAGETLVEAGETPAPPQLGSVTVRPDSPYGVLFLESKVVESKTPTPAVRRGPVLRLWPEQSPLNAPVELAVPIPAEAENLERLALYRLVNRGWKRVQTRRDGEQLLAEILEFGDYAVLEDTTPPAISEISVKNGIISARLSDAASGIARADIFCNGNWLLAAYDPEAGTIRLEQGETLPPAPRQFVFTATDNAGNEARIEQTI